MKANAKRLSIIILSCAIAAACSRNSTTVEYQGGKVRLSAVSEEIIRVEAVPSLAQALEGVIRIFTGRIIRPDGEWYWSTLPVQGGFYANVTDDRAGFWKCPYHNGRMCMEIMEREGLSGFSGQKL